MTNDNELLKVKEDIDRIKQSIRDTHLTNIKNFNIRNLKVCGNIVAALMPYVLVMTGLNYLMEKTSMTPITVDNIKYYEHSMNYFNSDGDEVETITHGTYNNQKSELRVISNWEQSEDGEFIQKREKYNIKNDISLDVIYDIVTNKNEVLLKPILGNPIETEISTKKELTDVDKEVITSYEATINRENKENYVLRPESTDRNYITTLGDISVTLVFSILYSNSNYMLKKMTNVGNACKDYKLSSTRDLEKELKEQKKKYKTLSKKI